MRGCSGSIIARKPSILDTRCSKNMIAWLTWIHNGISTDMRGIMLIRIDLREAYICFVMIGTRTKIEVILRRGWRA